MRIAVRHGDQCYWVTVTAAWAARYDNGALVSCGLTVGVDLPAAVFERLVAAGRTAPMTVDEWQHSSCLSRCVRRGDDICQW